MLLVLFQVVQNVVLLSQFCIEKVRVTLKFICEFFIWLINEFGFIIDSFQECFVNFRLNIVLVIFFFIVSVVIECLFNIFVKFLFLLIQILDNIIVILFPILPNLLNFLHLRPSLSKLLNFRS